MKMTILKNCSGSENGYEVLHFSKGQVLEMSDTLAVQLMHAGFAAMHEDSALDGDENKEIFEKKINPAIENKAIKSAPKNKGLFAKMKIWRKENGNA